MAKSILGQIILRKSYDIGILLSECSKGANIFGTTMRARLLKDFTLLELSLRVPGMLQVLV